MSNNIFPTGLIIDYTSLNIEKMQYYAKLWNIEYTKMENGLFEGSLFGVHTPRIQLAQEHFSQSFMTRGGFPDGCVLLLYSTSKSEYNFQNLSIKPHEIVFLKKGDELDILTAGAFEIMSMVIEEEFFYKEFYNFFGDISESLLQNKRFTIQSHMIEFFHNSLVLWKNYLTNELPYITATPDYNKIESEILRDLFSSLSFSSSLKARKKFQTKKVRDILYENINLNIDMNTLADELKISESQLYYAFKTDYGMTPKKYLLSLRLSAVRKELILGHPRSTTVIEIAQKYNFFHMGHFSKAYKKRFMETPSETLKYKNLTFFNSEF